MTDDSRVARQIYADAVQRDPEEWDDFLEQRCAGDAQLLARVRRLLYPDLAQTAPVPSPVPGLFTERQIGKFILRRELGRGGMGVVYLADDTTLGRAVALKALTPALTHSPDMRVRLENEARIAANLAHPGIATVYDLAEVEGELYLVCEYVPGAPLRALVQAGPLPIADVVGIGLQLTSALAEAHTKGIVHRDIKPENIIQTPSGVIKVLDFGLAKANHAMGPETTVGVVVGTPAYLAPEQATGQPVDHRTDIFAVGLLLYELATGRNPFASSSVMATLANIREHDPPPMSQLGREHRGLEAIIRRCLQKAPAARYQSTLAIAADLEQVRAGLSVSPMEPPRPVVSHAPYRWLVNHQVVMSVVYVALLYPAWYAHRWLPVPWHMAFVLTVLACAAAGVCLRLHLVFTVLNFQDQVPQQHASSRPWIRLCDTVFGALLAAGGLTISAGHPEFAMLFVAAAMAVLVAAFVIEPATTRAAIK